MKKRFLAGVMGMTLFLTAVPAGCQWVSADTDDGITLMTTEAETLATESSVLTASGTTTATTDSQYLELTLPGGRVSLVVDEVYVEAGDTVEEGQALLKLTEDSMASVLARLESQFSSAQTALTEAKLQYESDLLTAKSQLASNKTLSASASATLSQTNTSLAKAVATALSTLEEAQEIISSYPAKITATEKELTEAENQLDDLEEQLLALQKQQLELAQKNMTITGQYEAAKASYESQLAILQYAQGYADTNESGTDGDPTQESTTAAEEGSIQESSSATDESAQESSAAEESSPESASSSSEDASPESSSAEESSPDSSSSTEESAPESSATEGSTPDSFSQFLSYLTLQVTNSKTALDQITVSYEAAVAAEKALAAEITELTASITTETQSIRTLEQELSTLETQLERAQTNLTQYEINYANAQNEQTVKGASALNTYNTTMLTYKNADSIYQLAVAKLEATLESAQTAYDTAAENLEAFQALVDAGGILYSSQAGYLTSVTYSAGDYVQTGTPLVSYYNGSQLTVSVTIDQAYISQIAVGDVVTVQISSAMTRGTVSAINAQTESTSISNVTYTVEITIDNTSGSLSSGQTAQILFTSNTKTREEQS